MTRQLDIEHTQENLQAELAALVNHINDLKNDYEKLVMKIAKQTLAEAGFLKGDIVTWGDGKPRGELSGADWNSEGIVPFPSLLAKVMVAGYDGKRKAYYPESRNLRKVTA